MNKLNATLGLAAFAIASLISGRTTSAQPPPDNVQGNWTIYATSIRDGSTVEKHIQIAQDGNHITGYFEGPDQSGPIQGEVNGHNIRFNTVTRTVLHFRGQIFGNDMSGDCGIRGKHAPWQAIRTSGGVVELPAPAVVSYSQPVVTAPPAPVATTVSVPQPTTIPTTQAVSQGTATPTAAPLSSEQLDALVAPIALYPDALVAQVLAASTFPDQVAIADYWLTQNSSLTGTALAQAVDQQSWDASVKALTQFPSVLHNLAKNLSWTSSLGQAFSNQQSAVMAAVQTMRAKAQAAGTLQSTSQITITQPNPGTIVIQPANPQVVYVPQYNPTLVYGAPLFVPLYTPPVAIATAAVSFGPAISIGAVFGGGGGFVAGGFGWGWHAWACNWGWGGGGGSTIIYNHNTYITNNTWRTSSYNGYHPWGPGPHGPGPYGPHPYDPNYHPGTDTHYGPNGGYHPNGYYGPNGHFHPDVPGTNPHDMPNGGANGNHGLIGGNGGMQNPNAGMNGPGVAPAGGYNNDGHGGGTNGLLGAESNHHNQQAGLGASRMSADGARARAESNRGRSSMASRRPQTHMAHEHAPAQHHFSGGGRRR